MATIDAIVATAGFGLINLIPLLGLAVLPLQIAAWLVRGFVFQYLALAALGAYLTHYRHYAQRRLVSPTGPLPIVNEIGAAASAAADKRPA